MEKKKFIVVFTDYNVEEVYAFSSKEAGILAQAKQIQNGNTYTIAFIKNEDGFIIS